MCFFAIFEEADYGYVDGNPDSYIDPDRLVLHSPVLVAIRNGVIGAISEAAGAYANGGRVLKGAVFGGVADAAIGFVGTVARLGVIGEQVGIRAIAGGVSNLVGQHSTGSPTASGSINWGGFWGATLDGLGGGLLAARGHGAKADALSNLGQIGQRILMGLPGSALSATSSTVGTPVGRSGKGRSCTWQR